MRCVPGSETHSRLLLKAAGASLTARLCHPQLAWLHLDLVLSAELKSYPQKKTKKNTKNQGIGNFSFFSWAAQYSNKPCWQPAGRARKVNLRLPVLNDLGCIKEKSPQELGAASQAWETAQKQVAAPRRPCQGSPGLVHLCPQPRSFCGSSACHPPWAGHKVLGTGSWARELRKEANLLEFSLISLKLHLHRKTRSRCDVAGRSGDAEVHREELAEMPPRRAMHVDESAFPSAESSCKGKNLPGRWSRGHGGMGGASTCAPPLPRDGGLWGSALAWGAAEQSDVAFRVTLIKIF